MPIIGIRTSEQTLKRFEQIHEKLGLKTKGQTFETLVFSEGKENVYLSERLENIETKLKKLIELTEEHL